MYESCLKFEVQIYIDLYSEESELIASLALIKIYLYNRIKDSSLQYYPIDEFFRFSKYIVELMNRNEKYIEILNRIFLIDIVTILNHIIEHAHEKITRHNLQYYLPIKDGQRKGYRIQG